MAWSISIYTVFLFLSTVVTTTIAVVAWRRRENHGSLAFFLLMFGIALWSAGNTLQLSTTDLQLKLLFRTIAYVGHNTAPIALLLFALVYTGHGHWVTRRAVGLLALEPMAVAFVATPTNALGWHTFIWRETSLATVDGVVVLERSFGPLYWVNTAYNYTLVLISLYLFVYLALQSHAATRRQGLLLIAGVAPPFFSNVAWILGLSPVDFTPVAFTITGGMFAIAIYRYRLFEVVPVARETVLDAVNDGYVVLDENDRVTDINRTAIRHVASINDPIGSPAAEVIPAAIDRRSERDTTDTRDGHDGTIADDVFVSTDDDEPRYFEVQTSTISRARFTGRLILFRNVTEQRTVRQWYQALIEHASDLVAVVDERGNYMYHSPSSTRILGYEPEDLVGKSIVPFIHPDDREVVIEKFERCVDDQSYQPSHEYRFKHGDGTWIWLESRGRNHLEHPIIQGIVVNSRNVTEQKIHEKTLEERNERLQELANVAAHDLRNPLQVISGRIEHARETGDERHFEAIERSITRVEALIEDVLTLAREGDMVREQVHVEVGSIARQTWRGIEVDDATLIEECDDLSIEADRSKLTSLFENLFSNAIEHGGMDVSVRVGPLPDGFFVEDDGDGIPLEVRPRIFDRGFSTEPGGSGLGLPIVQSIATAHGWNLELIDRGRWTRFEVRDVDPVDSDETKIKDADT